MHAGLHAARSVEVCTPAFDADRTFDRIAQEESAAIDERERRVVPALTARPSASTNLSKSS